MKKRIIAGAAGLVLLIIVLIVAFSGKSNAIYITTAKVKTQSLVSDIDYSGVISAQQNVPVTSDIGGRVLSVNAVLGQTVKKDDVLFTVDSTDITLQYNQAQANYQVAEVNYEKVSGGSVKEAEMQLRQTLERAQNELRDAETAYTLNLTQYNNNTTIAAAQSAYDMAKAEYDRISLLVSLGEESQYTLDTAKSKMDTAKAQLDIATAAAQTTLNSAESRLKNARLAFSNAQEDYNLTVNTLSPENISGAAAQRDAAKAALDIIKRKLDNTAVKATADGLIATSSVKVGDIVAPQTPVMTVVSTGNMEIILHVTESGIEQVKTGMQVKITVSGTGETFAGKVAAIAAAIDPKSGLTDVKVTIDNTDNKLKAGMLASAQLISENDTRKIYVPVKAVISADNSPYVYIIDNGKLKKITVTLGEERYSYVEVTQGLTADAQVVVEGNTKINENSVFHIVKTVD